MTGFDQWVATAEAMGFPQQPGASAAAISGAAPAFTRLFDTPLPADYANFLRTCDGYEADGSVIYGLADAWDDEGAFRPGLFDSNERLIHGSETVETSLRFVGESGRELFAYDTASRSWRRVDRISWEAADPDQASFTELFTDIYSHLI